MSRIETIYPTERVSLREVGLRDGLQLVKKIPSTEAKQRWVREEYAAGAWTGVIPFKWTAQTPVRDPRGDPASPVPANILNYSRPQVPVAS